MEFVGGVAFVLLVAFIGYKVHSVKQKEKSNKPHSGGSKGDDVKLP